MKTWLIFAFCVGIGLSDSEPLFIAFGDFGHRNRAFEQVVSGLKAHATPRFVTLLGDLFYPKGVQSVSDSQFGLFDSFSSITDTFYVAVGNHDYGYVESVPAILEYAHVNPKWVFPSQYYLRRINLNPDLELCLIVLDTYIFEAPQLIWFRETLASCQGPSTYRIVATHFPLLTVGIYAKDSKVTQLRNQILPLLEQYDVHAYISGHEHQMQALERGGIHFLVSGATSLLNEWNPSHTSMWESELKFFNKKDAGLLAFWLSDDGSLTYNFVRASDNAVLYSSSLRKPGVWVAYVATSGPTQSVANPDGQPADSPADGATFPPSDIIDGATTMKPKSAMNDSGSPSDNSGTGTLFYISSLVAFALAVVAV